MILVFFHQDCQLGDRNPWAARVELSGFLSVFPMLMSLHRVGWEPRIPVNLDS